MKVPCIIVTFCKHDPKHILQTVQHVLYTRSGAITNVNVCACSPFSVCMSDVWMSLPRFSLQSQQSFVDRCWRSTRSVNIVRNGCFRSYVGRHVGKGVVFFSEHGCLSTRCARCLQIPESNRGRFVETLNVVLLFCGPCATKCISCTKRSTSRNQGHQKG